MSAATRIRTPVTPQASVAARRGVPPFTWIAAICAGIVTVYALDAWVLQPEAGTSGGARLLRLAGILVVSRIAAAAWRTLGRRARGILAVVAGLITVVVTAAIPLMHLVKTGASLREVLGTAALAAGILLVAGGLVASLRAAERRHGARRLLPLLALPAGALVALFVMLPLILAVYATNAPRPVAGPETPADLGLVAEDVRITAADGVQLAAWWIAPRNGAAVIVLHGSGSTRDDVLGQVAVLARHGYGVLAYDARGHGQSGGQLMELGWNTVADVGPVVDFVAAQPGVTRGVGLLGLSMGGEVALEAASSEPRVGAVVAEGVGTPTFADVRDSGADGDAIVSGWVMHTAADLLSPASPPVSLTDAVRAISPRPVLIIVGGVQPESRVAPGLTGAGPSTSAWVVPGSPHIGGLTTARAEYERRVVAVFDGALDPFAE